MPRYKKPLENFFDWISRKIGVFSSGEKFQPIITKNRESFFQPVSDSFPQKDHLLQEENQPLLKELEEKALLFWQIETRKKRLTLQQQKIVFLILFVLVAIGLFTNNLLFSILLILVALIFWFAQNEKLKTIDTFGITEEGVFANNSFYEFSQLKSFWIFWETKENRKELFILKQSLIQPEIYIPLIPEVVHKTRELLLKHLPEEKPEEKVIDYFSKNIY